MRTPPPPDHTSESQGSDSVCANGSAEQRLCPGKRLSPELGLQTFNYDPCESDAYDKDQDPRFYFMKQRKGTMESSRPRRLISRKLPLEITPMDSATCNIMTRVRLTLSRLGESMDEYVSQGLMLSNSDGELPLQLKAVEDVDKVELRLKQTVNKWLTGASNQEVEYSLRSMAKGKIRV